MPTYEIVRFFSNTERRREIIASGLTLDEAKAHCSDPETSSRTATDPAKVEYTARVGHWFDGYEEE